MIHRAYLFSALGAPFVLGAALLASQPSSPGTAAFAEKYCAKCHNDVDKEGNFDVGALAFTPDDPANFQRWVQVHDRLQAGEMPPKEKKRPDATELEWFLKGLASSLSAAERASVSREGRTTQR